MELNLKGKVAIVTGASKGIGAGIAKALAAEGVAVAVNYASSREGADRVVADIVAAGGRALAIQADVSRAAEVNELFAQTHAAFGALDIVVNNAGIYGFGPVESITESEFHRHFNTNVLGLFLTTQAALTYFPATGGSIVNISSVGAQSPMPSTSLYAASKAAGDTITVALAKELAARHIRVNTVAPGPTNTEGVQSQGDFAPSSEGEKFIVGATPLGRLGQPADIAAVVVFLVSDAAAWLTGERIRASGGLQ